MARRTLTFGWSVLAAVACWIAPQQLLLSSGPDVLERAASTLDGSLRDGPLDVVARLDQSVWMEGDTQERFLVVEVDG